MKEVYHLLLPPAQILNSAALSFPLRKKATFPTPKVAQFRPKIRPNSKEIQGYVAIFEFLTVAALEVYWNNGFFESGQRRSGI